MNYRDYFAAERAESFLFIAVGVIALAVGAWMALSVRKGFALGLAAPLIAVALIQLVVGTTVALRSPQDAARVERILSVERPRIASEEIPRMQVVMKNFLTYRYVEMALILAGLALMFGPLSGDVWRGAGIGLFIQASLMLALDFFAERRGAAYLDWLAKQA